MVFLSHDGSLGLSERMPIGLRIAQVVGLTSAAFFCELLYNPALLEAPAPLLAKQWKKMYDSDKNLGPAIGLLGTTIFGYLASKEHGRAYSLYTASAMLMALTGPYTILVSGPITEKLEAKADSLSGASITDTGAEAGVAEAETVHALVDRWATMNLGIAVLAGLCAVFATWAAVDKLEAVPAALRLATGANRMGR